MHIERKIIGDDAVIEDVLEQRLVAAAKHDVERVTVELIGAKQRKEA